MKLLTPILPLNNCVIELHMKLHIHLEAKTWFDHLLGNQACPASRLWWPETPRQSMFFGKVSLLIPKTWAMSFICFKKEHLLLTWISSLTWDMKTHVPQCVYPQQITVLEHPHWCSVCDPAQMFLTSKFSHLLFYNATHKTETKTANRWELLIANNLDQSLWLANQKQGEVIRSSLLDSSLAGTELCCASYWPQITFAGEQLFSWSKPAHFHFPSFDFTVQGHMGSTGGDALSHE
jgi:hypothetical protein